MSLISIVALWGCSANVDTDQTDSSNGIESNPTLIESSESDSAEIVESEEEETEKRVSFIGVGDNLIHDSVIDAAQLEDGSYDFTPMYDNVATSIEEADLAFLNQETILAGSDYPYAGYPSFNTPDEMAQNMHDLGFDLINGATNHTLDYDYTGAIHAKEVWNQFDDLIYTGNFLSEEDRNIVPTMEKNGVTFSFLAYTYGTNGLLPDTDWRVAYFDEDKIREDVARAKEISDVVIVSAHWGDEDTPIVNEFQKNYAQLFADLEVDAVIGTHPHHIQPIEWLTGANGNETLIVYSLGNFLANALADINTLGGMITFDFVVNDEGTSVENIIFKPTISHFTAYKTDMEIPTKDFKIYMLDEYTDELASEHGLNRFDDIEIKPENYQKLVDDIISPEFLETSR